LSVADNMARRGRVATALPDSDGCSWESGLRSTIRNACLAGVCLFGVGAANAQDTSSSPTAGDTTAPALTPAAPAAPTAPTLGGPYSYQAGSSMQDQPSLQAALRSARAGDVLGAQSMAAGMSNPVARKLVLWAIIDAAPERLTFAQLDQARRDLWGWPRAAKRQAAVEKQLTYQSMPPQAVIDWFKGDDPTTAEGAMALAAAYKSSGQIDKARTLIRHFWRDVVFESDPQQQMLARFGDLLTVDDHVRRADMLLYGQQGPAALSMISLLPPEQQELARARMAFRDGDSRAELILEHLPPNLQDDPGVNFERARYLVRQKDGILALGFLARLPTHPPGDAAGSAVWTVRRGLIFAALGTRNYRAAYQAASENGLQSGVDYTEAEFYAGWLALTKLKDPALADQHFAHIIQAGSSPITVARALYWRGRAAEAGGDPIGAQDLYAQGAKYITTFYGQLSAGRAGVTMIDIGHDPTPTAADRTRFEGREVVQAARLLANAGERDLLRAFVLAADDNLPSAEEYALLVDLARGYGEQDLSMRVVRAAAQRGYVLPDRGYPVLRGSEGSGAEQAFVLSIARQESNFDPDARSGVGARGLMQLMPSTAAVVARRMGMSFSPERLYDADYNMRLGSSYLGRMVDDFGGSYVMAAASYNAGPNHMPDWTSACGDPRTASGDPVDFIECIPFSETRNYAMRIMETTEVYRARLNGGHAPLDLWKDLKRGGYTPGASPYVASTATPATARALGSSTSAAPSATPPHE
jgi:soluble lytic murein transglycosylase